KRLPKCIEALAVSRRNRGKINILAGHMALPIIGIAVERNNLQTFLNQPDEGNEEVAVQAARVEIGRRRVRRGNHDDTTLEKHLEQAPEDHCVRNVRDLEFVETQ